MPTSHNPWPSFWKDEVPILVQVASFFHPIWSHSETMNSSDTKSSATEIIHHHHIHWPDNMRNLANSFKPHLHVPHLHHYNHYFQSHASNSDWSPASDIRENKDAYYIDMDLPGLTSKDKISIQWMTIRTIVVEGFAERPDISHGVDAAGEPVWAPANENKDHLTPELTGEVMGKEEQNEDGHECKACILENNIEGLVGYGGGCECMKSTIDERKEVKTEDKEMPRVLLGERKYGPWQRSFTLPPDCNLQGMKAKVEAGMLRMYVPKRDIRINKKVDVKVT